MTEKENGSHPYGFPDEWFYRKEYGEGLAIGGVRAFEPPDPEKLPADKLKSHPLFQRLLLSLRDFAHARSAIVFIREDVDFEKAYSLGDWRRFNCYETTLIVSYCRPFSMSKGGLPPLTYKALGVRLSPFTRALHDMLVDRRNRIFAHSDLEHVEMAPPVVMHANDSTGKPFTTLYPPRFREETMLSENELEQVDVLLGCAIGAVTSMLQAMHHNFKDHYPSRTMNF